MAEAATQAPAANTRALPSHVLPHVLRGIEKRKRQLSGVVVEDGRTKKQRVADLTLTAREVMLTRLDGDLGYSVDDAEWERLVELTKAHPKFTKLFSFPSDTEPGWVKTKPGKAKKSHMKILAIDCEMCVTATVGSDIHKSNALCRVSAVDGEDMLRNVVADFIVRQPEEGTRLVDAKTDIHGITPDMILQSKISIAKAQKRMLKFIGSDTIVVGHSVSGDLAAMRIDHSRVIDTALIYQRKDGAPTRRTPGLRDLTKFLLKFEMPDGHDSTVDAQATMLAAKYAARNPVGSIIPSALELHGPRVRPNDSVSTLEVLRRSDSSSPAVNQAAFVDIQAITGGGATNDNTSGESATQSSTPLIANSSRQGVEAAIARSCHLRVHRIPKGITSQDIEKFFVETTKIVPTAVEQIVWLPAKNRGSCSLTFATNAHAALAFECASSGAKAKATTDSIGRAQKTITVVTAKGKKYTNIQLGIM